MSQRGSLHAVFEAIVAWLEANFPGEQPDALKILLRHRSQPILIPVPHISEPTAAPADEWPPAVGWAFRPGQAAYQGVSFRLIGKALALLQRLARRPGTPVSLAELRADVWPGYQPEDGTVRAQVSSLRKQLRDALHIPPEEDPILAIGDSAYQLELS